MGRNLRHMLVFLLLILKETRMPEANCRYTASLFRIPCTRIGFTRIPKYQPKSVSKLDLESTRKVNNLGQPELTRKAAPSEDPPRLPPSGADAGAMYAESDGAQYDIQYEMPANASPRQYTESLAPPCRKAPPKEDPPRLPLLVQIKNPPKEDPPRLPPIEKHHPKMTLPNSPLPMVVLAPNMWSQMVTVIRGQELSCQHIQVHNNLQKRGQLYRPKEENILVTSRSPFPHFAMMMMIV
ncbi:hypothetical protein Bbelb_172610 [Branchiostoma belcheri]|nr:hypothetical protein Bbelb_172610 [Branchiostoma belcheri]